MQEVGKKFRMLDSSKMFYEANKRALEINMLGLETELENAKYWRADERKYCEENNKDVQAIIHVPSRVQDCFGYKVELNPHFKYEDLLQKNKIKENIFQSSSCPSLSVCNLAPKHTYSFLLKVRCTADLGHMDFVNLNLKLINFWKDFIKTCEQFITEKRYLEYFKLIKIYIF